MTRNLHRIGGAKSIQNQLANLEHEHRVEDARRVLGATHVTQQLVPAALTLDATVPQQQIIQQVVYISPPTPSRSYLGRESNTLPILLNILFIPGTGQMAQGRIGIGILFVICWIVSIALCFALVGFFLLPIVWLIAMADVCSFRGRIRHY